MLIVGKHTVYLVSRVVFVDTGMGLFEDLGKDRVVCSESCSTGFLWRCALNEQPLVNKTSMISSPRRFIDNE